MPTPETIIKNDVFRSLYALEVTGTVTWFERLNSGRVKSEWGSWIQLCRKGTFDFFVLFDGKDRSLCGAFIEVKRGDKKARLSPDQELFKEKYSGKHPHVFFWLVQSGCQVKRLILEHAYDRINDV